MKTGVSLPAEESGRIQPVSAWSARSEPTLAFGHEISVTPLQMAMAFSAVANNGILMRPRVIRAWVDGQGRTLREEPPRQIRRVISDSSAATLRAMMTAVVEYGTAADIRHPTISIAGKTGTAEKIDPVTGKYMHGHFHSSFIGMAPADHPAFVCLVMLDEPVKLKYGGQSAAPIFREILDRVVADGLVAPRHPEIWVARSDRDSIIPGGDAAKMVTVSLKSPSSSPAIMRQVAGASARAGHVETAPTPRGGNPGRMMPDLRNATLRDALHRLQELDVEVEYHGEGKVLEQDPAPGTSLRKGGHCRLKLGWMG